MTSPDPLAEYVPHTTVDGRPDPRDAGDAIAATLHAVGTNFGDHGETVVTAMEVAEDETVRAFLERLIPDAALYRGRQYEHFVTLRFVTPAAVHDNAGEDTPTPEPF